MLGNFIYKVITKILAHHLGIARSRICFSNHFGFIKGCKIEDCIVFALGYVNLMNNQCFGGNIAMEINIRKAFDTLQWSFLLEVLKLLGFLDKFCNLIQAMLEFACVSILIK